MKTCELETCQASHDGTYASGRFCSRICSNSYVARMNRKEKNKKIREKLLLKKKGARYLQKSCKFCGKVFSSKKLSQITCSNLCGSRQGKVSLTSEKKKQISLQMSKIAKERHSKNDPSFGWKVRSNLTPSYPESIAIAWFQKYKVSYVYELNVGKYFVDFSLVNKSGKKIAIEIDGQQHLKPERKKVDNQKDLFLKSKGWKAIRIAWPSQNIKDSLMDIVMNENIQFEE